MSELVPGLLLDEGIGTVSWFRETPMTMQRFPFHSAPTFQHRAPAFLVLEHATFDALLPTPKRKVPLRVQLEAIVPDGATPFAPLPVDAPFWRSVNALSAHLGGPTLPLPDGPSGVLDSGRPYCGSSEAQWTHAGIQASVKTNRLEHVVVFKLVGPDPALRPTTKANRAKPANVAKG